MVLLGPWCWGAMDSLPLLHGLRLLRPFARMCREMVCSWEGSQHAQDSYLARSGCLQARGAGYLW